MSSTGAQAIALRTAGAVQVRDARRGDETAITAFYAQISDEVRLFFEPFLTMDEALAGEIISKQADGREVHIVAEAAPGDFVAHCFLWGMDTDEPELGIGVRESHQNQGLGRELMGMLIDRARAAGKPSVRLTVFVENERARHLYESLGFVVTGQREVTRSARFDGRKMVLLEMQAPLNAWPTSPSPARASLNAASGETIGGGE